MYSKILTSTVRGIKGMPLYVEADASSGLPNFIMVGNLASNVKEAADRIRTALHSLDISLPAKRVTINICPADIRKEGTHFDLALTVAVLKSLGYYGDVDLSDTAFIGELGLNGEIIGVRGVLSMVSSLKDYGCKCVCVPKENANEAAVVQGIKIISFSNLKDLCDRFEATETFMETEAVVIDSLEEEVVDSSLDFADVSGQYFLKRACEVAVAGMHNILFSGPAGSGKTMIAKRIPSIMPPLTLEENIEISKIYSIAGLLPAGSKLISKRPFRSPHHSITIPTLIGGGNYPLPGEISLSHKGVLFLDEIPLFSRFCIETLRQPLEDKYISVARIKGSFEYPANFMLVAAMNPCPCGHYPDRNKCHCKPTDIRRYQRGISKPILERIDICAESSPISFNEIQKPKLEEASSIIRERVIKARNIQLNRFKNYKKIKFNSEMTTKEIKKFCSLGENEEAYLEKIFEVKKLSARTYHKLLKVARTIADLAGSEKICVEHLVEAANYRGLEEKLFDEFI